jgi:uroporphyrinogen decarboxylase
MKHRDRVALALNHEKPDRCPMQISFTPEFSARLREDMGQGDSKKHNPHGGGNTYDLELALDEDLLLTSVGWANSYYSGDDYVDEWGIRWVAHEYETKFGKGCYTEIKGHPLADVAALDRYQPPDPLRPELYLEAQRLLDNYRDEYFIVGVTVTTIWETAWALRGLEPMLMDLVVDPDLAERVLDIPYHYHLTAAKKLTEMGVDMIWIGDDVGTQNGMLINPALWRKFFKPRMANFIQSLKAINPQVKVAYHSDGNVLSIIPELIEIGLDVLNPIQPASMDPAMLKQKFGDNLCFWGSIDEQHTLPFGTPSDVETEVRHRLDTIGRDGGLIIGPTHHVQLDTPLENFWAMVNTVKNTPY